MTNKQRKKEKLAIVNLYEFIDMTMVVRSRGYENFRRKMIRTEKLKEDFSKEDLCIHNNQHLDWIIGDVIAIFYHRKAETFTFTRIKPEKIMNHLMESDEI